MFKTIYPLLFFFMQSLTVMAQSNNNILQLKESIQKVLSSQKGVFAVAFKDESSGAVLYINEHENFHAASTMKTPVMIEVFKQVSEGKLSMSDSIILKNEFKSIVDGSLFTLDSSSDSETDLYKHLGEKRSLHDLVYDMIIVSSNLSTNLVIELAGPQNVMKTMRELGANEMQVRRGVEDSKAFEQGLNNTTTAYDLAVLFDKMAKGEIINQKACDEMINILLDQRFNTIIPAGLPPGIKVAHKTGSITGVHHDSGIVFLPGGRKYVLVLLSKNWENEKDAISAMAGVSKLVYEYMTSSK